MNLSADTMDWTDPTVTRLGFTPHIRSKIHSSIHITSIRHSLSFTMRVLPTSMISFCSALLPGRSDGAADRMYKKLAAVTIFITIRSTSHSSSYAFKTPNAFLRALPGSSSLLRSSTTIWAHRLRVESLPSHRDATENLVRPFKRIMGQSMVE
jgi:hypothetical protein